MQTTVSCPVFDSFRVQQVAGMFDVPLAERTSETFTGEIPPLDEPWQIGLIVGPSGAGKSTIARAAFGRVYQASAWPTDRAVIDCFGQRSVREITSLLTAVGFSSPPSWIKPYHVLSGGEKFRCDLARALVEGSGQMADGSDEQGVQSREQGEIPAPLPRGERLGEGFTSDVESPFERTSEQPAEANPSPRPSLRGRGATDHPPSAIRPLPAVVFDEFTSVVDRNVAKVASAAIARGIRRGSIPCRFVAVTCHYDVAEWLEADWVLDMATGTLTRRRLRRPAIELALHRTTTDAWPRFARHHYLSGSLARQARCYVALWNDVPVYFAATLPIIARKGHRRFTRIVTLPDFQGIGIGMTCTEAIAQLYRDQGYRMSITSSHPALVRHCKQSPRWRATSLKKTGQGRSAHTAFNNYTNSGGRSVVSFEFLGEAEPPRTPRAPRDDGQDDRIEQDQQEKKEEQGSSLITTNRISGD